MKTLSKILDFIAFIMEALLTDPLNSRICWTALIIISTWLGIMVGWAVWLRLFEY
jgi:hypothetical protein